MTAGRERAYEGQTVELAAASASGYLFLPGAVDSFDVGLAHPNRSASVLLQWFDL